MKSTCVLPHRHEPDRPRRADDGIYVCRGCFASLEQALAEMPAQFEALARALAAGPGSGPQVSGTPESPLPINPAVAEHRADIRGKLASWSALVAEERGISAPRCPEVWVTAGWLLVHLRWACAQPWVDEYAAELRALRGRSGALLSPTGRRRVEVGACIEAGCLGVLTAMLVPEGDWQQSEITCSEEPEHAWGSTRWISLGLRIFGARSLNGAASVSLTGRILG